MLRLLGEDWENDVRKRTFVDTATGEMTVEHWQDPQAAVDMVQAINTDGAKTLDGLGRPVVEIPVVAAMEFCRARGIPWERFMYGREYDGEFKRFCAEYTRLTYAARKTVHAVA